VELVDSRRLTGPNLHTTRPGAVAEVRFEASGEAEPEQVVARWRAALELAVAELGWEAQTFARRFVDGEGRAGAELMVTAEVDQLYVATDLNEWAIAVASGVLPALELDAIAERGSDERAARAGALDLVLRADAEGVPRLIDDGQLSIGYFGEAQIWALGEDAPALPTPDEVEWARFSDPPVAIVTGTNGKTTTTRLLARMVHRDGRRAGNTSTDGLYVDEHLVEAGDWTGPGGARAVLRHPEVDLAVLEAARGGLLRRGLAVQRCDVSVITNVEADHLGEYGVFDLEGMAEAKGIVARATKFDGLVVAGADSPALLAWIQARIAAPRGSESGLDARVALFSLDPQLKALVAHHDAGGEVWTVVDGWMVRRREGGTRKLVPVADMPLAMGGRARHNVANALAAAAAARKLGIEERAIVSALLEFGREPEDNPGRARLWSVPSRGPDKVDVLVDFAHNLAGLEALAVMVGEMAEARGRAPILSFAMAGDRSDDELRALGRALRRFAPRILVLREQVEYLRGRPAGEVSTLLAAGYGLDGVELAADEPAALDVAMRLAEAGDWVVLLAHTEREAVAAWMRERGAR